MMRLFVVLLLTWPLGATPPAEIVVRPAARLATEPVATAGDSADDPAIWCHPTRPEATLILGTNKQGGLCVYGLDGKLLQVVGEGWKPNNVDVIYNVPTPGGAIDVAVASLRGKKRGVGVWHIDAKTARLRLLGVLEAFGGDEPYGLCGYRSRTSGKGFVFVNEKGGRFEQHELTVTKDAVSSKVVRRFRTETQPEGCVADDEQGHLYFGEEAVGVWKTGAEPDAKDEAKLIAKVGENGLKADVEGLALYCTRDGGGYLIVSSQGNDTYKVYRREADHRFVMTIDPVAGTLGKPTETDGIAVSNRPAGRTFPRGMFAVQDGKRDGGRQRFLVYAWEDIAGERLSSDPTWSPRR